MKLFGFDERYDPLIKMVRAVHSSAEGKPSISPEDLTKQRNAQDLLAKMITTPVGTSQTYFSVKDISCAWAKPDFPHNHKKIILYCHGGGYTCGSLKYAGILANRLAFHTGFEVAYFEYRLAPEHPYPQALEDAIAVWDYLMYIGFGAQDITLIGDSAGGNMALELCLHLKEQQRQLPRSLVLLSPWTDMTMTSITYITKKDVDPLITKEYVSVVREAYAPETNNYADPKLSPLFADLHGLPETYIQVGENEILLNDSIELSEQLKKHGVRCKLDIYENGWHVFQQLPVPRSIAAVKDIEIWLQEIGK